MRTFRAYTQVWDDSVNLLIGDRDHAGRLTHYVDNMTLIEHQGGVIMEPSLRMNKREAQELLDALWGAGVRPSNGEGNAGQLGATEKHLEDMRKLVFK